MRSKETPGAGPHPLRSVKRLVATAVAGCVATLVGVVVTPVSAAAVACDPAALVTALGAVSGSGQTGTVTLTAGCTYTMTGVDNTTDGPNAFPDILGHVTLVGNGATITRSTAGGTPDFRFFLVDDGGSLNISSVTLSKGSIASGDVHGGGAILTRSTLAASAVIFANNTSLGSTGGGAIDNHDAGRLTVDRSTFTGNSALQGGAIEDEATLCHTTTPTCAMAAVTNSTFTNNSTTMFGGGAFEGQLDGPTPAVCGPTWPQPSCQEADGAHDTLIADTFSGNSSVTEGGGIASFGTMTLSNSTVYNNTTGSGGGGGIQNTGTITITQSTIAANSAPNGANLHSFTDTAHQPGITNLAMTIVTGGAGGGANCSGTNAMTDNGYNLDSGTSCGFASHALNSTNPMLGPLASNGGPTQTMSLQAGSPAIDAIPSGTSGCTGSTDQRGVSRPQGTGCDIGAFEAPGVWTSLGGILTSAAAVASSGPARTDVFVRGTDNALYQRTWNGTSWSAWTSLGGVLTSSPSAISWGPNRIDVFVRGTDNGLWQRTWNGTTWSSWVALGGILTSGPGTASWGAGHLDVFVRGTDNALYHKSLNGTTWSGWERLGGILTSDPTAVSWGTNRIDVFVRGTDNGMWQRSWNGSAWSAWQPLGGVLTSGIGAASCTSGHLDVYVLGTDTAIYHRAYNGTWSTWQRQGGSWTASPSAACPAGTNIVSLFERGTDRALWLSSQTGT